MGLGGGVVSLVAYGLVLLAQTSGALAAVAALRELSIAFGVLSASSSCTRRSARKRLLPALVLTAGAVVLALDLTLTRTRTRSRLGQVSSQVSTLPRAGAQRPAGRDRRAAARARPPRSCARSGPRRLTIRTVAGRAGVSPATAYTYFASKQPPVRRAVPAQGAARAPGRDHRHVRRCSGSSRSPGTSPTVLGRVAAPRRGGQPRAARHRPRRRAAAPRDRRRDLRPVPRRRSATTRTPELPRRADLALTGALLQTGMGLITYDDLADRLDARVATIMRGNA